MVGQDPLNSLTDRTTIKKKKRRRLLSKLLLIKEISSSLANLLRKIFWTTTSAYFPKTGNCYFAETVLWICFCVWEDISDVAWCKCSERWIKKHTFVNWDYSEGARSCETQRKQSSGEPSSFITCWSLRLTEWREYVSRIWIKHCNNVKKSPNTSPNLMFYLPL